MQSKFIRNARLDEAQERLLGEISRNVIRYTDDTTVMAESEEELKSLLMKVKEESEKAVLKFNIQITKMMASGPITSWPNRGENNGNSDRLYFLGLKKHCRVTTAMKLKDACSLEEKLR